MFVKCDLNAFRTLDLSLHVRKAAHRIDGSGRKCVNKKYLAYLLLVNTRVTCQETTNH